MQLSRAIANELGSYFHCYYWCRSAVVFFVCTFSGYLLGFFNASYVLLVATVSCTIGTVINLGWFIQAGKVGNWSFISDIPWTKQCCYSKMSCWRNCIWWTTPSRLDLVKQTHAGYIKDVEVEDVKAFLYIQGICSLVGFFLCFILGKIACVCMYVCTFLYISIVQSISQYCFSSHKIRSSCRLNFTSWSYYINISYTALIKFYSLIHNYCCMVSFT